MRNVLKYTNSRQLIEKKRFTNIFHRMYCVERESFINVIQLKRGIEEKLNNLRIYNFKAFSVNKFFETIMAKQDATHIRRRIFEDRSGRVIAWADVFRGTSI